MSGYQYAYAPPPTYGEVVGFLRRELEQVIRKVEAAHARWQEKRHEAGPKPKDDKIQPTAAEVEARSYWMTYQHAVNERDHVKQKLRWWEERLSARPELHGVAIRGAVKPQRGQPVHWSEVEREPGADDDNEGIPF